MELTLPVPRLGAAREGSRHQDGKFGPQVRTDNDNVQLAGTVPQEQACLRTDDEGNLIGGFAAEMRYVDGDAPGVGC